VASVWKHPKSQYWTACFRDQNGRQRRISTKETNNKKTLKIAEEFERAIKTKRTLKQVQNILDRLHAVDKTGTITEGRPHVTRVVSIDSHQ
jgi:hypothetical protein